MKLYSKCLFVVLVAISSLSLAKDSNIFLDIDYRDNKSILKWLKRKPDFNVLNEQGQSVLIKAVQAGNTGFVKKLLKTEIDLNAIDSFGKTALDYAVETNHKKIVLMLAKKEAVVTQEEYQVKVQNIVKKSKRNQIIGIVFGTASFLLLAIPSSIVINAMCFGNFI